MLEVAEPRLYDKAQLRSDEATVAHGGNLHWMEDVCECVCFPFRAEAWSDVVIYQ